MFWGIAVSCEKKREPKVKMHWIVSWPVSELEEVDNCRQLEEVGEDC